MPCPKFTHSIIKVSAPTSMISVERIMASAPQSPFNTGSPIFELCNISAEDLLVRDLQAAQAAATSARMVAEVLAEVVLREEELLEQILGSALPVIELWTVEACKCRSVLAQS